MRIRSVPPKVLPPPSLPMKYRQEIVQLFLPFSFPNLQKRLKGHSRFSFLVASSSFLGSLEGRGDLLSSPLFSLSRSRDGAEQRAFRAGRFPSSYSLCLPLPSWKEMKNLFLPFFGPFFRFFFVGGWSFSFPLSFGRKEELASPFFLSPDR